MAAFPRRPRPWGYLSPPSAPIYLPWKRSWAVSCLSAPAAAYSPPTGGQYCWAMPRAYWAFATRRWRNCQNLKTAILGCLPSRLPLFPPSIACRSCCPHSAKGIPACHIICTTQTVCRRWILCERARRTLPSPAQRWRIPTASSEALQRMSWCWSRPIHTASDRWRAAYSPKYCTPSPL